MNRDRLSSWVGLALLLALLTAAVIAAHDTPAKHADGPWGTIKTVDTVSVPQTAELEVAGPTLQATPPKSPTLPSLRPEPEPEPPATVTVQQPATQQDQAPQQEAPAAPAPQPAPEPDLAATVSSMLGDYGCGGAYVSIQSTGWQAQADWYDYGVIVNPDVPRDRLRAIVAHECAHLVQYAAYGGGINDLARDADRVYGANGLEQLADCMALQWGQVNGHYTTSCGGERGTAAALVASGQRINSDY